MRSPLLLMSVEAAPLLLMLAGVALIVGARAWAGGLLAFGWHWWSCQCSWSRSTSSCRWACFGW